MQEEKGVRQAIAAILNAASEGTLDEWSSVSDLEQGHILNTPIKEACMYIGIGTALLIIILLIILL